MSPVLDLDGLAARWSMPVATLRRRLVRLNLPAFNIGTRSSPDWRFRLASVERWEQQNEETLGPKEPDGVPIPTGVPPGLEGFDPSKGLRRSGFRRRVD